MPSSIAWDIEGDEQLLLLPGAWSNQTARGAEIRFGEIPPIPDRGEVRFASQ